MPMAWRRQSLGIDLDAAGAHPFHGIRFCEGGSSVEARFPKGHGWACAALCCTP